MLGKAGGWPVGKLVDEKQQSVKACAQSINSEMPLFIPDMYKYMHSDNCSVKWVSQLGSCMCVSRLQAACSVACWRSGMPDPEFQRGTKSRRYLERPGCYVNGCMDMRIWESTIMGP